MFPTSGAFGQADADPARYVNSFIGTGEGQPDFGMANAAGNTPPGAAYPFGMALWSPDTTLLAGGYRYSHDRIGGFSLTHFSGRGISCYQDLPILPALAPPSESPGANWGALASRFQHDHETASPGLYSVTLDSGIRVDLTVTARTGFGVFTFPSQDGTLLINAGGSANGNRTEGTEIRVDGPLRLSGSAASGDCGGYFTYRVYFAIEFERAFASFGTWEEDRMKPYSVSSRGSAAGAWVAFDTRETPGVKVKVGLSYVSSDNAAANLLAENPGWDFEETAAAARAAWNHRLGRVQVSGGSDDQKTVFYTALYHSFQHPSVFSDVNGEYLGFDNKVHNAGRRIQYHNFAAWDTYRSQTPLIAMLAPEASDMMESLVNDALQDAGGGLPRWQHANTNSGGMIGDSQDAVIATAYAFGARDFDAAAALSAMDRGASRVGTTSGGQLVREGLDDYLRLGYVSTGTWGSAARTLEYAIDDFCIARLARALGDEGRYEYYQTRAQNWSNLLRGGYIVPRNPDGSFIPNFVPSMMEHFVEGTAAQYRWMVPFNLDELIDAVGGDQAAVAQLDRHFAELNAGPGSEYGYIGNEPGIKTPWVYVFAGAPYRTQQVVRQALLRLFLNAPGGLPGNDDGGTLSSWAVFASIGIYPKIPGVGGVVVGSPIFTRVEVQMANGASIVIDAPQAEPGAPFVRHLRLNGETYARPWIPAPVLSRGVSLEFTLSDTADPAWGADNPPPSYDAPN